MSDTTNETCLLGESGVRHRHSNITIKCKDKETESEKEKEKEEYVFKPQVYYFYIVDENEKTVTAGSIQHTSKILNVTPYDMEEGLYTDLICNMLIFSKEGSNPIAVGYLLNGKITPLTDELKKIASVLGLPVSDTHFDDTKDNSSCIIS